MRYRILFGVSFLLAAALMGGCKIEPLAAGVTLTPSPTITTPLPLSSLLPTLAISPAVATLPTIATPTMHQFLSPDADVLILQDDFSSNRSNWQLPTSAQGATTLADGNLVMTAGASYTTLEAFLPAKIPNDFYAEITIRTRLCQTDNDTFGLAFRVNANVEYRLVATCGGQMRFEHITNGALAGENNWTKASGLATGAPSENRIGVQARGMGFQFFVNGNECFSYNDSLLDSGTLGLFIHTLKGQLLTVSFDDLSVYSLKSK